MNSLIVAFLASLIAAIVAAAELDNSSPIPIIKSDENGPNPDGSYQWSYETGNGIKAEERGEVKKSQLEDDDTISVQGSFSYTAEDGTPISLTYTANENGFQPKGDHLPIVPEIPSGILKALEWIAAHPEEDKLRK